MIFFKQKVSIIQYLLTPLGFSILVSLWVPVNAQSINLAEGHSYTLLVAASEHYPDTGNLLTDGRLGVDKDLDCGERLCASGWVGFDRGLPVITIDLEDAYQIDGISASFLSFELRGVYPPSQIRLESSFDGLHWLPRGKLERAEKKFELKDIDWKTQYLRFFVARNQWTFLDEIRIDGNPDPVSVDNQQEALKRVLVVTTDLPENDERKLRLANILDGMGTDFDVIETEQLDHRGAGRPPYDNHRRYSDS